MASTTIESVKIANPQIHEILCIVTPLLTRNLDLEDYDVTEQLQEDDVITLSDSERYIDPLKHDRYKQIQALIQLLKHRQGDVIGSLKDALHDDAPFLMDHLQQVEEKVKQQIPQQIPRVMCIHCALINGIHDAQDICHSLYADGYFSDDTFHKLLPSSKRNRKHKLCLLLHALSQNEQHPLALKSESAIESLKIASKEKYPDLAHHLSQESDLSHCLCQKGPSELDKAIEVFRSIFQRDLAQSPQGKLRVGHAEGGPDLLQAKNVQLCIQIDAIINSGSLEKYETYAQQLLEDNPGNIDIEITVMLHNILAYTTIIENPDKAESYFSRLDELVPKSQCAGYFEIDFVGLKAHVYRLQNKTGLTHQYLSDGVQKAENTVPDRISGFVFSKYALFLIHVYRDKLYSPKCPKRRLDEIESYFIAASTRLRLGAERLQNSFGSSTALTMSDCYSQGAETMLYLTFFYLRACMEGHMTEYEYVPEENLEKAGKCLIELRRISSLLPERFQVNVNYAESDFFLRQGESHPSLAERQRLIREAHSHAEKGLKLATTKFSNLCDVGHRKMKYLNQRIQYTPDALLKMDFSTTATSDTQSVSDADSIDSLQICPQYK